MKAGFRPCSRFHAGIRLYCRIGVLGLKFALSRLPESVPVFSIIQAAGWPIWPLLFASVVAVALIIERATALRRTKIVPVGLLQSAVADFRQSGISDAQLARLEAHSPLGRVLAAGMRNARSSREIMKEAIEEAGRGVAHELERFLTTLGTIASIAPLMGLFGTVVGMIEIFASQTPGSGFVRRPGRQLAHGISDGALQHRLRADHRDSGA
jgi:biopolymer transport protein ExbB